MATPQLDIDELQPAQSQPEITVNEAIRKLEAAISIRVLDKDLTAPPASPAASARYIVGAAATGAWSGQTGKVAFVQNSAWDFLTPQTGWIVYVVDEAERYEWDGSAWVVLSIGGGGGSVTVEDSDSPPTGSVAAVSTIEFNGATITDLGGGRARVTIDSVAASAADMGMFFPGNPSSNQLLLKYIATRAMTFPSNFAGAYGHIGTNPTSSFIMNVSVNGSVVGTITVSTGGVFTFATTAGASVPVSSGERIEIAGPASADGTAADISATLTTSL